MANTISVDATTVQKILDRLGELTKEVHEIKEKLSEDKPPYGSDAWWELSDKRARTDIKHGKYTMLHNKKELQEHLDSLKRS